MVFRRLKNLEEQVYGSSLLISAYTAPQMEAGFSSGTEIPKNWFIALAPFYLSPPLPYQPSSILTVILIKSGKIFFLLMFIFERDRVWAGEGQREGDTECEAGSRLQAVSTEPDAGLEPTDCKIMTWTKVGHVTDRDTQAPQKLYFRNEVPESLFAFTTSHENNWVDIYQIWRAC